MKNTGYLTRTAPQSYPCRTCLPTALQHVAKRRQKGWCRPSVGRWVRRNLPARGPFWKLFPERKWQTGLLGSKIAPFSKPIQTGWKTSPHRATF